MAEKTRYSDEELQEFKELILEKLDKARKDYDLLKGVISGSDGYVMINFLFLLWLLCLTWHEEQRVIFLSKSAYLLPGKYHTFYFRSELRLLPNGR